jgi:murein DD-endopeptidase MepM/ murein hydrolase activator NlpD
MKNPRWLRRTFIILVTTVLFLALALYLFLTLHTSVTKNLDTYVYNLPFKEGSKYKVIQGYGGLFSHRYTAALDFNMPEGTPVCAAREGIIYAYKDDSNEGGPFSKYQRKANYIIIQHNDGSYACYWHLQKNGVLVKNGRVAKGQVIGYSGKTGFVYRAHLHFSVKRIFSYDEDAYLRTKFKTTRGVIFLQRGETYQRPM